jgi:diguanylate cyclase (GGDEF)-like protein
MGREEGAAVQIRDPNISRRAALIEFANNGRVMITDLGSRNGVWVNGVQISRAEIHDGHHIQLSNDTVLRVRFQDPVETEILEEMQVAVVKDALTGLPNRRYVVDRLTQELSYARRRGEPTSVALIDIDDFKKVVDADGPLVADKLLLEIAKLIRKETRVEDVVARYGADELLVIMRGTDRDEAGKLCERLRKSVHKRVLEIGGDVPIRPSISAGLTTVVAKKRSKKDKPSEPLKLEAALEAINQSDTALFKAKEAGKNQLSHWGD